MLEFPDSRPAVMGHEAAGVVGAVGSEVADVTVGQMVAVTCQRPCMRCSACARGLYSACSASMDDPNPPFSWRGEPVRSIARSSSLASQIVVDELQVHPMSAVSAAAAALIGCAVTTGYGMVRNVARLQTGELIAVIGVGGIGINSIQTSRLIGARRIVAVDINPDKADVACKFGADQFVHVDPSWSAEQVTEHVLAQAGERFDAVIEGTGHPTMISAALAVLAKGGRLAVVGIPTTSMTGEFNVMDVMARHITIAGALNGACNPFVDMPDLVRLAEQGRIDLENQISHRFPLNRYDEAIAALRGGKTLRVVIDMCHES
jgi:S-(hydroxymethyl)glutathione dehydrogenase/alcohol dehydrogenase